MSDEKFKDGDDFLSLVFYETFETRDMVLFLFDSWIVDGCGDLFISAAVIEFFKSLGFVWNTLWPQTEEGKNAKLNKKKDFNM
jgi:hypothetical protein